MASGLGSGSSERPGYVDLDAPNPSGEDPWDPRSVPAASHQLSGSSGSKKPKKAQNPNLPGKHTKITICLTSSRWRCVASRESENSGDAQE